MWVFECVRLLSVGDHGLRMHKARGFRVFEACGCVRVVSV